MRLSGSAFSSTPRHSPADSSRGMMSQPKQCGGMRSALISSQCSPPPAPTGRSASRIAFIAERMCTESTLRPPGSSAPSVRKACSIIMSRQEPSFFPLRNTSATVLTPCSTSSAFLPANSSGASNSRTYHQ